MKKSLLLLLTSSVLTGCSACMSSIHYTYGTQCLERGDYDQAVISLSRAVELDPDMARNHSNLAAACIGKNEFSKAWYHLRQATLCSKSDSLCDSNFKNVCRSLLNQSGLDKPGSTYEEIENFFGEPDEVCYAKDGTVAACCYGIYGMKFSDNKLIKGSYLR